MEYKQIADVRKPVSRIVFGTDALAMMRGENISKLLDAAFASGINTFDFAGNCRTAERLVGDWMASGRNRESVVIVAKGLHSVTGSGKQRAALEAVREDLEMSLRMFQTDFIDIYLLGGEVSKTPAGPLVETLNELKEEGKIGIFGASSWRYDRIEKANEYAYAHDLIGFTVSRHTYGLAERTPDPKNGGADISGEKHKRARRWYMEEGIEVFACESRAHGFLSGKFRADETKRAARILDDLAAREYCRPQNFARLRRAEALARAKRATVPQIALAFALRQPLAPMAVCSAPVLKELASDIRALEITLAEEEIRWLEEGEM